MTAGERIDRAVELMEQAVHELEDAAEDVPAYSVELLSYLRAEIKVSIRRAAKVGTVLRGVRTGV